MAVKNYNATKNSKTWMVGGSTYLYPLDSNDVQNGKMFSIGYCIAVDLAFETEKVDVSAANNGANTVVNEVVTSNKMNLTLTLRDVQPENVAIAMFGEASSHAAEVGRIETQQAYAGGTMKLDRFIDPEGTAPVITSEDGGTTYVVDENYILNEGSVYWLEDQTGATNPLVDGNVKVTYDALKGIDIDALTDSNKVFGLYFEGENIAEQGELVKVNMFKVSLDPTENYNVMSTEDFATLTLGGTVLESKAVTSGSKFYKETRQVS